LNFGNPYKPEIYWQFKEAVAGIGDACRALNTPVTGGNVSFYNESPTTAVYPTPVIGMVGLIDDVSKAVGSAFIDEGDAIILLGKTQGHIGGSEYLSVIHGVVSGDAPPIELEYEKRVQAACLEAIDRRLVKSAHDCSEGGLAVAIAECCMPKRLGAWLRLPAALPRIDFYLFGEDQSRIVLSCSPRNSSEVTEIARSHSIDAIVLGSVGGKALRVEGRLDATVDELASAYYETISTTMD
jgi:phosphoribosylformylglycinamidine synthase